MLKEAWWFIESRVPPAVVLAGPDQITSPASTARGPGVPHPALKESHAKILITFPLKSPGGYAKRLLNQPTPAGLPRALLKLLHIVRSSSGPPPGRSS